MLYLFLIIILIYLSEIGAYVWHRWGTHENYIPKEFGIQNMHDKHHNIVDDQAHGDFLYILFFLLLLFFLISSLLYIRKISFLLAAIIYIPIFLTFLWNWYIHSAYHIENHWLTSYEWFRNDKRIHMHHHIDPSKNYGIATHFNDIIFDTFDYGLINHLF
jgi:hypothetical protein